MTGGVFVKYVLQRMMRAMQCRLLLLQLLSGRAPEWSKKKKKICMPCMKMAIECKALVEECAHWSQSVKV
jgi:hypothetical protein